MTIQQVISIADDVERLKRQAFLLYAGLMGAESSSDQSSPCITEIASEIAVGLRDLQKKVERLRVEEREEPF